MEMKDITNFEISNDLILNPIDVKKKKGVFIKILSNLLIILLV